MIFQHRVLTRNEREHLEGDPEIDNEDHILTFWGEQGGWELISVVHIPSIEKNKRGKMKYYFKRPKKEF